MANNLKPCPCCGGEAEYDPQPKLMSDKAYKNYGYYSIHCSKCFLQTDLCLTPEEAEVAWNKRVSDEEIELLKKELAEAKIITVCDECGENIISYKCDKCGKEFCSFCFYGRTEDDYNLCINCFDEQDDEAKNKNEK